MACGHDDSTINNVQVITIVIIIIMSGGICAGVICPTLMPTALSSEIDQVLANPPAAASRTWQRISLHAGRALTQITRRATAFVCERRWDAVQRDPRRRTTHEQLSECLLEMGKCASRLLNLHESSVFRCTGTGFLFSVFRYFFVWLQYIGVVWAILFIFRPKCWMSYYNLKRTCSLWIDGIIYTCLFTIIVAENKKSKRLNKLKQCKTKQLN